MSPGQVISTSGQHSNSPTSTGLVQLAPKRTVRRWPTNRLVPLGWRASLPVVISHELVQYVIVNVRQASAGIANTKEYWLGPLLVAVRQKSPMLPLWSTTSMFVPLHSVTFDNVTM